MISLRQNKTNVGTERARLTTFEVLSELVIQAILCGEKLTDILLVVVIE